MAYNLRFPDRLHLCGFNTYKSVLSKTCKRVYILSADSISHV